LLFIGRKIRLDEEEPWKSSTTEWLVRGKNTKHAALRHQIGELAGVGGQGEEPCF
jgi:hypothetical protein